MSGLPDKSYSRPPLRRGSYLQTRSPVVDSRWISPRSANPRLQQNRMTRPSAAGICDSAFSTRLSYRLSRWYCFMRRVGVSLCRQSGLRMILPAGTPEIHQRGGQDLRQEPDQTQKRSGRNGNQRSSGAGVR